MKTVKYYTSIAIFLGFIFLTGGCKITEKKTSTTISKTLNMGWMFREVGTEQWMPAEVPGTVHTDLMKNELIEDPFYRLNEHDVQWIDKKDWEYRTTFMVDEKTLEKDVIELVFKGLDTYASVYLNNDLVLQADNMFRTWQANVKEHIRGGENELRIVLESPIKLSFKKYNSIDYTIPVSDNDLSEIGGLGDKKVSVFTRKAGYHFGWDWGPRLVTSGIWRDVELVAWSAATIENLYIKQNKLDTTHAALEAKLDIKASQNTQAVLEIFLNQKKVTTQELEITRGYNPVQLKFDIKNPELWWPNGMGEQPLYTIKAKLKSQNQTLSETTTKIGLRTIEVVRDKDNVGSTFYFKVNGQPVFMKGANYIPQDVFLPRVKPEQYKRIIESAVESNMNMLRVWGGGIYEENLFYDLCDQNGILIWQDFMFACAMYPGDEAFLENVKQEAIDNVKRLRNHPSIALWCGNNECLSAWYNWGWKETVIEEQGQEVADIIWEAYEDNFHGILPDVIKAFDENRFYWASSPSAGTGIPENWFDGDVHYWGVWWGKEPFSNYNHRIPRFMSEYGFQSFPELSTVEKYAVKEDYNIFSEVMKSHQRSSIGNGTIKTYMQRHYNDPKNFEMFLYLSHLLQAEGIKTGMESHRKNMPYCMGSLFWQINDCWPVASWSSIDYYGKWKAQQYFARQAFTNILIAPETDGTIVKVYGISDHAGKRSAVLEARVMDFEGNISFETKRSIMLQANTSTIILEEFQEDILKQFNPAEALLYVRLSDEEGNVYSENIMYFVPPKDLKLTDPEIFVKVLPGNEGVEISVSAKKLAKNIYFTAPGVRGFFTNNYFDILPGEVRKIKFKTDKSVKEIKENLKWLTLVDSY